MTCSCPSTGRGTLLYKGEACFFQHAPTAQNPTHLHTNMLLSSWLLSDWFFAQTFVCVQFCSAQKVCTLCLAQFCKSMHKTSAGASQSEIFASWRVDLQILFKQAQQITHYRQCIQCRGVFCGSMVQRSEQRTTESVACLPHLAAANCSSVKSSGGSALCFLLLRDLVLLYFSSRDATS